jgi:Leucine-rich repeat (LRR) protein
VLPEAIGDLKKLIHLNLSGNKIKSLPEGMSKLTELRVCDLSDNELTEIPESFGQVRVRYQLRIKNNPISHLPEGFAEMPGTIDVTGTKIDVESLPPKLRARIDTKKPDYLLEKKRKKESP